MSALQLDNNKLTRAVLSICVLLVDFGAYTSVADIKQLLSTLDHALDSANDLTHVEELAIVVRVLLSLPPSLPLPPTHTLSLNLSPSLSLSPHTHTHTLYLSLSFVFLFSCSPIPPWSIRFVSSRSLSCVCSSRPSLLYFAFSLS